MSTGTCNPCITYAPYYMCPSIGVYTGCGVFSDYYCARWGCETIASDWGTNHDPHITVVPTRTNNCVTQKKFVRNLAVGIFPSTTSWQYRRFCANISITIINPKDRLWEYSQSWGLRYYKAGTDRGGQFTIQKIKIREPPQPIGPNPVLNPPKPPNPTRPPQSQKRMS